MQTHEGIDNFLLPEKRRVVVPPKPKLRTIAVLRFGGDKHELQYLTRDGMKKVDLAPLDRDGQIKASQVAFEWAGQHHK